MKKFSLITIALLISLLGLTTTDLKVRAVGNGSEAACDNASNNNIDPDDPDDEESTPFSFNFDAGAGNTVSGVCIKSGNNMFGDSHSGMLGNGTYENGCYTVSGVGTQFLTVTRNLTGNSCQGISHLDIDVDTAVTPTDVTPTTSVTPTDATPTETITPTPTDEVTPTDVTPTEVTPTDVTPTDVTPTEKPSVTPHPTNPCEGASCNTGGGDNTPTPTEDVTPTAIVTETPNETVTPTLSTDSPQPTSGQAGPTATATPTSAPVGGTTNVTTQPTETPSVQGAAITPPSVGTTASPERVLGASTMANTGTFEAIAMTIMGMLGALLIGTGYLVHRKEARSRN